MNKTKVMIFFALFGFVLSFVTGLIASVSFGMLLLRAVLCAVVAVGLYCGASFVYARFLAHPIEKREEGHEPSGDGKKHRVDITLGDSVLPDDENGPSFKIPKELMPDTASFQDAPLSDVAANTDESSAQSFTPPQALSSQDEQVNTGGADSPQGERSGDASFGESAQISAPVGGAAVNNAAPSGAGGANPTAQSGAAAGGTGDVESELGSLPDMENVFSSIKNPTGEVITNSDFAKAGATATSDELKNADTEIMARAIHTVLARAQD